MYSLASAITVSLEYYANWWLSTPSYVVIVPSCWFASFDDRAIRALMVAKAETDRNSMRNITVAPS